MFDVCSVKKLVVCKNTKNFGKKTKKCIAIQIFFIIFAIVKEKNMGVGRFDRDTHQIILKTEVTSLANGGPHKTRERIS